MRLVRHPVCVAIALLATVLLPSTVWAGPSGKKKDKAAVPTVRWAEGKPGEGATFYFSLSSERRSDATGRKDPSPIPA